MCSATYIIVTEGKGKTLWTFSIKNQNKFPHFLFVWSLILFICCLQTIKKCCMFYDYKHLIGKFSKYSPYTRALLNFSELLVILHWAKQFVSQVWISFFADSCVFNLPKRLLLWFCKNGGDEEELNWVCHYNKLTIKSIRRVSKWDRS